MKTRVKMTARSLLVLALALTQLWLPYGAGAQVLPPQNPTQFDVTGFIQAATLDNPADPLSGGTITVNHQVIVVPKNTILQMPAAALTWQQVFAQAPAPYGLATTPPSTGLAMNDVPKPLATYEAHVVGNRVKDAAGNDRYIAGLIFLAQHSLQSGQGFINFIDYATGTLYVGGTTPNATTGARVKVNDPLGRFGRAWTPDQRFTIDEDNPTIRSESAYPMCTPRVDPLSGAPDTLCPQTNRPTDGTTPSGFAMIFTMPSVAQSDAAKAAGVPAPDPRLMAPFEIGDFVTYSGILVTDDATQPTVAPPPPAPGTAPLGTYIAAFQVIGNVGLFTFPGDVLAYMATDVMLLGVGGQTVAGLAEATARTRFEGFTTDATRNVLLYALDVDACSGAETPRAWGSIDVDPGPPNGAVLGRWRFRPPSKILTGPPAGTFLPPPREMRAAIETAFGSGVAAQSFLDAQGNPLPGSNQYTAPIFEYLFPENAGVGTPIVPNNFEDFPFLTRGSGPLDPALPADPITNPIVGQLDPWPLGFAAPPAPLVCAATGNPTANAGANQTVASGSLVTLTGTGTDPNGLPLTFTWTQNGGPAVALTQPSATANPNTASFLAPVVAFGAPSAVLTFQLTVSNGSTTSAPALVTVTVNPVASDSVTISLVEYRTAKRRLTVDATTTAVGRTPAPVLTMQAFDGSGNPQGNPVVMPFVGGAIGYEVILVGVAQPASVKVTSSYGGVATSGLTRLRQ
ncbi:MAG TPA: hypothetical protein VLT62_26325 [Candidatus Methylomirabilis sp.]|nr:hypothetical protein [Candidatus Methylomirabilis sp.]